MQLQSRTTSTARRRGRRTPPAPSGGVPLLEIGSVVVGPRPPVRIRDQRRRDDGAR